MSYLGGRYALQGRDEDTLGDDGQTEPYGAVQGLILAFVVLYAFPGIFLGHLDGDDLAVPELRRLLADQFRDTLHMVVGKELLDTGFASGSEIAFFSLGPNELNELEEEKNENDRLILKLREDSERTLATILITNNLVNVTIIMLCNYFIAQIIDFGEAYWLQFICLTVLLTFILLLFGEIMPKVFSSQQPLKFCRRAVAGIKFCRKIFYPFATILLRSGILASKVVQKENKVLSVDDLEQALELTDKEDIKDEKNMLEGIVRFGDETAFLPLQSMP